MTVAFSDIVTKGAHRSFSPHHDEPAKIGKLPHHREELDQNYMFFWFKPSWPASDGDIVTVPIHDTAYVTFHKR